MPSTSKITASSIQNSLSLNGAIYEDMNKNGIYDANESGIPEWGVGLKLNNTKIADVTTNESGMYSFRNLVPGSYTVIETQKTGWTQTAPGSWVYNVTLTDKDAYRLDFGNYRLSSTAKLATSNASSYTHTIMHFTPAQKTLIQDMQRNLTKASINPQITAMLTRAPGGGQHFDLLSYLSYVPSDRNQGACGDCWAWGSTACIEVDRAVRLGTRERLSVQYLNSNYKSGTSCGFACCGGWPSDAASFYNSKKMAIPWSNANAQWQDGAMCCGDSCTGHHFCDTSHAQTSVSANTISTNPNYPIASIEAEEIATHGAGKDAAIANIKNVLSQNKAVAFCYFMSESGWDKFYKYWDNLPETAIWSGSNFTCGQDENGGHCVVCVGYDDSNPSNRYWIMLNSWGTTAKRPNGVFRVSMDLNYDCADKSNSYSLSWNTFSITNPSSTSLIDVGNGKWTTGYTSVVPFSLNNVPYLFEYKSGVGTWYITRING